MVNNMLNKGMRRRENLIYKTFDKSQSDESEGSDYYEELMKDPEKAAAFQFMSAGQKETHKRMHSIYKEIRAKYCKDLALQLENDL